MANQARFQRAVSHFNQQTCSPPGSRITVPADAEPSEAEVVIAEMLAALAEMTRGLIKVTTGTTG